MPCPGVWKGKLGTSTDSKTKNSELDISYITVNRTHAIKEEESLLTCVFKKMG
jgi:hypothetical protein